jgi:hypothetical protein
MGIGVHYFSGGKRKSFDLPGVPAAGSEADRMLRIPKRDGAGHAVKLDETDTPGFLSDKLSGSISSFGGRVCLKGEEVDGNPMGKKVYATVDGARGWFPLSAVDPAGVGSIVGPDPGFSSVEADTRSFKLDGSGFGVNVCSRVVMAPIDVAGHEQTAIYAFFRAIIFSPLGRVIEIGPEKRQMLGMFKQGGGGSSKFGVRPIFDGDVLSSLDFGTSSDLEAYDESADAYASENVKRVDVEPCDEEEEP